jgi:hypothetical protein
MWGVVPHILKAFTVPGLDSTHTGVSFLCGGLMCAIGCTLLCRRMFSTSASNAVVLSVLHMLGYQELRLTPALFALHLPLQVLQNLLTLPIVFGMIVNTKDSSLRFNLIMSLMLSLMHCATFMWKVHQVKEACGFLELEQMSWKRFQMLLIPLGQSESKKPTLGLFATQTAMIVLQGKSFTELTLLKIAVYNTFVMCCAVAAGYLWFCAVTHWTDRGFLHVFLKAALWIGPASALTWLAYAITCEFMMLVDDGLWLLPWFKQSTFVMSLRLREMVMKLLTENPYGLDFLERLDILLSLYKFGFPRKAFFYDVFLGQLLFGLIGAATSGWVAAGKHRNILYLFTSALLSCAGLDVGTHVLNQNNIVQQWSLWDHTEGIIAATCFVLVFAVYGQQVMRTYLCPDEHGTPEQNTWIYIVLLIPVGLIAMFAS